MDLIALLKTSAGRFDCHFKLMYTVCQEVGVCLWLLASRGWDMLPGAVAL